MLADADVRELRRLYRDWPFFRALVGSLEMTLAKSRLPIAASYLDLVPAGAARDRIWRGIEEEHLRVVAAVLDMTESTGCSTAIPSSSAPSGCAMRTSTR